MDKTPAANWFMLNSAARLRIEWPAAKFRFVSRHNRVETGPDSFCFSIDYNHCDHLSCVCNRFEVDSIEDYPAILANTMVAD